MSWNDTERQELEQDRPLPPYSKVTAVNDFEGEHSHDLPFKCGDQLTVLEPCNVIFWYLAEDTQGRRGVIPINFVQAEEDDIVAPPIPAKPTHPSPPSHPPAPLVPMPTPPERRQRKCSPQTQTIPRSTSTALHKQLSHTSSSDQFAYEPSLPSPPPMPPKTQRPPLSPKPPPTVKPRPIPPPKLATQGSSTDRPPVPLPQSPGIKIQGSQTDRKPALLPQSPREKPRGPPIDRPPAPSPQSPRDKPRGSDRAPAPLPQSLGEKQWGSSTERAPAPLPQSPGGKPRGSSTDRPPAPLPQSPGSKPWGSSTDRPPAPLPQSPGSKPWGSSTDRPPAPLPTTEIDSRSSAPLPHPLKAETQGLPPIDIDNRPPAPLPPEAFVPMKNDATPKGKYATSQEFIQKSGWFQPTVEAVLCRKSSIQLPVFQTMRAGVYIFRHKRCRGKQYVGKSRTLHSVLIQMFHRLYEKPENKLNPLELELKYHSPDADEWYVRFMPVLNAEKLNVEEAKIIVQFRTVQPEGLNPALEFHSREDWYEFAAWYKGYLARKARQQRHETTI